MALQPDSLVTSTEEPEKFSYRCPGCGEMVDKREMASMLEHHRHVLHPAYPPAWFQEMTAGSRRASASHAATRQPATRVHRSQTYATSAESNARRYGH
jgi:hypothetical protein